MQSFLYLLVCLLVGVVKAMELGSIRGPSCSTIVKNGDPFNIKIRNTSPYLISIFPVGENCKRTSIPMLTIDSGAVGSVQSYSNFAWTAIDTTSNQIIDSFRPMTNASNDWAIVGEMSLSQSALALTNGITNFALRVPSCSPEKQDLESVTISVSNSLNTPVSVYLINSNCGTSFVNTSGPRSQMIIPAHIHYTFAAVDNTTGSVIDYFTPLSSLAGEWSILNGPSKGSLKTHVDVSPGTTTKAFFTADSQYSNSTSGKANTTSGATNQPDMSTSGSDAYYKWSVAGIVMLCVGLVLGGAFVLRRKFKKVDIEKSFKSDDSHSDETEIKIKHKSLPAPVPPETLKSLPPIPTALDRHTIPKRQYKALRKSRTSNTNAITPQRLRPVPYYNKKKRRLFSLLDKVHNSPLPDRVTRWSLVSPLVDAKNNGWSPRPPANRWSIFSPSAQTSPFTSPTSAYPSLFSTKSSIFSHISPSDKFECSLPSANEIKSPEMESPIVSVPLSSAIPSIPILKFTPVVHLNTRQGERSVGSSERIDS